MTISRVAVIYDDRDRPETTGGYCRRALEALVEVVHFRPDQLGRIPRRGFDLYLGVDDGLDYRLDDGLRPLAWWAIDTHLDFARCLSRARSADLVFAAQRNGAERLRAEGVETAEWLPLACDPEIHRKFAVEKSRDVTFIGNVFPGPRSELLSALGRRFPDTLIGRAYFEEMARAYSASRVVFNRSLGDDVNMRVFEALACGSLLATNDLEGNGQATLFRDGIHLATYGGEEELIDKVAYYLAHEAAREKVAAAGRALAFAKHTYRLRMELVLGRAEELASSARVGPARWPVEPAGPAADADPAVAEGVQGPGPAGGYYEFARPELMALIPASAVRILDVGCGAGRLGEALKARQAAEVVGIELSAEAAARRGRGSTG
ncbi:glycosyltransferase family protein [Singulisphaera sp. PoT]|uniref:glycosyltransferase family protein n=1 Tax=Singulisphaera sp. PoT TaxID=3411797 RepID=UPI003BF55012